MDLDEIKRGLRAEIKKRENEQYFTFQCNVRQMCKDVLAKLEEQESVIAEKDAEIARLKAIRKVHVEAIESKGAGLQQDEEEILHQKYKRCLAMADYWGLVSACTHGLIQLKCMRRELKFRKLADKFKEAQ